MAYSKQNFQNGQTLDAANLETMENGIIAGQGVKNLLINSNFKDPINSSGKTSWSSSGFTIDKWRADSAATINLTSSGITVDATSVAGNLQQNIDNLPNGTYTFAALVNNVIRTIAFTNNNGTITTVDNSNASFGDSGSINAGKENSAYYVQINNAQGHTNTIAWAALYEGNYTVDTLPNYIPKDKHIEMINCGISLQPQNLLDNSNFSNPVNSRGKNTYSDEGNEYTIDRWKTKYKSNISIENGYINIFGRFGLDQYIQNPKDGIYTFAARVRINSSKYGPVIYVDDNSGSSNDLFLDANIGEWKTYILQHDFSSTTSETITFAFSLRGGDTTASISVEWAAMYKGAYTADTLPPYIPKGKHVEMLNCGVPLQPHNLLDNSDFRIKNNIINTKGLTDYSFDSGNVFDRWRLHWTGDGRVSIKDGYIELYRKTNCTYLFQHSKDLESMIGKTYTVAAKVRYNGYIGWIDSTQRINCGTLSLNDWDIATCIFTVGSSTSDIGKAGIEIATKADSSFEVQWVALYEGAYTKETLPAYVPKGKHVEMLNCGVPLAPHNLLDNSDFRNPVNQRGIYDTTESENLRYTIDRWKSYLTSIDVSQTGMLLSGQYGSNYNTIYQYVPLTPDGRIYTAALYYTDGTVKCASGDFLTRAGGTGEDYGVLFEKDSGGNPYVQLYTYSGKRIIGAALYEGAYDASTLPAYQPKGYAAELAECQRYFERLGGTFSQILGNAVFAKAGAQSVIISIKYSPKRLANPTLSLSAPSEYRMLQKDAVNASTISAYSITSFDSITTETPFAFVRVNLANALASDSWLILQRSDGATGAYIDVNADL